MTDAIDAISSGQSGRTEGSTPNYTPQSYNNNDWLSNKLKNGESVFTIAAGAAYNS